MDGWMDGWMVDGFFFGCKDGRWWKKSQVDGNKYWAKKEVLEFDLKTIWRVVKGAISNAKFNVSYTVCCVKLE